MSNAASECPAAFSVNDFVLAMYSAYPIWPGLVKPTHLRQHGGRHFAYITGDAPPRVATLHYWVYFPDDDSGGWVPCNRMTRYHPDLAHLVIPNTFGMYSKAQRAAFKLASELYLTRVVAVSRQKAALITAPPKPIELTILRGLIDYARSFSPYTSFPATASSSTMSTCSTPTRVQKQIRDMRDERMRAGHHEQQPHPVAAVPGEENSGVIIQPAHNSAEQQPHPAATEPGEENSAVIIRPPHNSVADGRSPVNSIANPTNDDTLSQPDQSSSASDPVSELHADAVVTSDHFDQSIPALSAPPANINQDNTADGLDDNSSSHTNSSAQTPSMHASAAHDEMHLESTVSIPNSQEDSASGSEQSPQITQPHTEHQPTMVDPASAVLMSDDDQEQHGAEDIGAVHPAESLNKSTSPSGQSTPPHPTDNLSLKDAANNVKKAQRANDAAPPTEAPNHRVSDPLSTYTNVPPTPPSNSDKLTSRHTVEDGQEVNQDHDAMPTTTPPSDSPCDAPGPEENASDPSMNVVGCTTQNKSLDFNAADANYEDVTRLDECVGWCPPVDVAACTAQNKSLDFKASDANDVDVTPESELTATGPSDDSVRCTSKNGSTDSNPSDCNYEEFTLSDESTAVLDEDKLAWMFSFEWRRSADSGHTAGLERHSTPLNEPDAQALSTGVRSRTTDIVQSPEMVVPAVESSRKSHMTQGAAPIQQDDKSDVRPVTGTLDRPAEISVDGASEQPVCGIKRARTLEASMQEAYLKMRRMTIEITGCVAASVEDSSGANGVEASDLTGESDSI